MTDPGRGAASEENKLEHARHAISMWWYLFGELLLWAQSQIAGYEYGRANPDFMEKLSKMFGHEITVDSHVLEYIGLCFSWNRVNYDDPMLERIDDTMERYNVEMDAPAIRYLIRELLMSRSANSSFWRFKLQSAVYALNYGQVDDLVAPVRIRRQGKAVQLLRWKVTALQHVHFQIGKGMKKYRALQLVADELGQSAETLRSWEKLIEGDEDLMMDLRAAEIAGKMEKDLDAHPESELVKRYGAEYHRHTTDIEYAKVALRDVRATPLDAVRAGLRSSRSARRAGSSRANSSTKNTAS